MEYPVGVEMSNTYLSFEVTSAALKLVRDFMLVKEGENVVITADTSADFRVVEAVAGAAYSVGANPVIIHYPTSGKAYEEPIRPVADAVVHADVWIELAYYCSMHTPCFRKAMENGARFTCLNGMDVIMLVNTVGRVDYDVLIEFGEYLTDKVHRSNEVIVTDKNGTNLVGYNQGRGVKHSGQRATKKGYPVMLGGQVSWCPVEETSNGKLILCLQSGQQHYFYSNHQMCEQFCFWQNLLPLDFFQVQFFPFSLKALPIRSSFFPHGRL